MSLNVEGSSCSVCHAYLFSEDDIVYCPVCGAPHHRECYNAIGHCALEEFHGTDRQYDKIKDEKEVQPHLHPDSNTSYGADEKANSKVTCQMCHEQYDESLNACPKCGTPNVNKMGGTFFTIDLLGGVPADYDIGEGVTADEAKRFVASNTPRYIPKFATLNKNNRVSWNWAAFLFPCGWMLSRKMYKNGIIAGLLTIVTVLLTIPFNNSIYNLGFTESEEYMQIMNNIYDNLPQIGTAVIAVAAAGVIINLGIRIFSALFGDYFYKKFAISEIKKINAESDDLDYDYRRKGGVNLLFFIIGVMAVEYIPMLIAMFIK